MTLRVRLLLTILLTAIPATTVMLWLAARQERRSIEESVRSYAVPMMQEVGRSACLRHPQGFVGGMALLKRISDLFEKLSASRPNVLQPSRVAPPMAMWTSDDVWAYRSNFVSDNKQAPPFPEHLKNELAAGADIASAPFEDAGDAREHRWVAIRTEWTNDPCAVLLVSHSSPRRPFLASDRAWLAIAQVAVLIISVLIACMPVVRRIRVLTKAVKESAASRYAAPVPVQGSGEIGRLARAFNEARDEVRGHIAALEKRETTLRDFIANTTHDVMLPLTVLQGHLSEMKRQVDADRPVDPDGLAACHREADYLTSILRNLAAVAKLEGADYQFRHDPIDLNRLVERVISRYRSIARVEGISLDSSVPDEDLEVVGDMTLLEQALGNVIHNAVRYNHPGGHVAVVLERAGDDARFSLKVIDDGPGMAEADLARITERRFRGEEARARNPSGLGLGLHIARDVALHHGFSLDVRRSGHGGLEVEFAGDLSRTLSRSPA